MATETKIGVGLMALLVGVFGVLVYTKWEAHRRETAAAESGSVLQEDDFPDETSTPVAAADTATPPTGATDTSEDTAGDSSPAADFTPAEPAAVATVDDAWGFSPAEESVAAIEATPIDSADDFGFASAPVEARETPETTGFDDFSFEPEDPSPAESPAFVTSEPTADESGFGFEPADEDVAVAPVDERFAAVEDPFGAESVDEFAAEPTAPAAEVDTSAAEPEAVAWDAFALPEEEPAAVVEIAEPVPYGTSAPPAETDDWGFAAAEDESSVTPEPAFAAETIDIAASPDPAWETEPASPIEDFSAEPFVAAAEPAPEPDFSVPQGDPAPVSPDTPDRFFPDVDVQTVAAATPRGSAIPDPIDLDDPPVIRPRRVSAAGVTLGRPEPANRPGLVVAGRNDSFWSIAERVYGEPKFYLALAKANADRVGRPGRLKPGMKVITPSEAELRTRFPKLCPRPTGPNGEELGGFFIDSEGRPAYRVRTNETLSSIAQSHLGRASRWVQIFALNRDVIDDVNQLKPHTVLRLPPDASRVRFAAATGG